MKKLLTTILLLVTLQCLAQRDTTIRHIYSKDTLLSIPIPPPTVTFTMWKEVDSVIIYKTLPVDTAEILRRLCSAPPPPVFRKLDRVLYVGSADFLSIMNGGTAAQEFKWYLQDYGYNGVSYYGLGSTTTADWPKIRELNKDLRRNYGVTIIEATGSGMGSLQSRVAFNATCLDAREKFDTYNNEDEYWNADPNGDGTHSDAEVLAAWNLDSASMIPMKAVADAAGTKFEWYHGWPIKGRSPKHMRDKLSLVIYHIYNAGTPNVNYGDWRWADMNAISSTNSPKPCAPLLSGEGAFSGPWFATHTLDQVDSMLTIKFKQYPNLKLVRVQYFMYSKMRSYQPNKRRVTPSGFARMAPIPRDTTTSKEHLDMARER